MIRFFPRYLLSYGIFNLYLCHIKFGNINRMKYVMTLTFCVYLISHTIGLVFNCLLKIFVGSTKIF